MADIESRSVALGRTGRAGQEGKAVTYFNNEDAPYLKMCVFSLDALVAHPLIDILCFLPARVANVMRQSGCEIPDWMLAYVPPSSLLRSSFCPLTFLSLTYRLKNPSKKERRKLKSKPVDRMGVQTAAGSGIKRQEATKRRFVPFSHFNRLILLVTDMVGLNFVLFFSDMVEGSKRRKLKEAEAAESTSEE